MSELNLTAINNLLNEYTNQSVARLTSENTNLFTLLYGPQFRENVTDDEGCRWKAQQDAHTAFRFDRGGAYGASDYVTYLNPIVKWARYGAVVQFDSETLQAITEKPLLAGQEMANQVDAAMRGIMTLCDTDLRTNDPTTGNANGFAGIPAVISASNTYAGIDRSSTSIWQAYINSSGGAITEAIAEDVFKAITQTRLRSFSVIAGAYDYVNDFCSLSGVVKSDPPRREPGQALTANLGLAGMNPMQPLGFYQERPIIAWSGWTAGRLDFFDFQQFRMQVRQDFKPGMLEKVQGADLYQMEITFQAQIRYHDTRTAGAATGLTT